MSAGLSNQAGEFPQVILKNASRMNRLTEDLLALASVESGDYKLRLQQAGLRAGRGSRRLSGRAGP